MEEFKQVKLSAVEEKKLDAILDVEEKIDLSHVMLENGYENLFTFCYSALDICQKENLTLADLPEYNEAFFSKKLRKELIEALTQMGTNSILIRGYSSRGYWSLREVSHLKQLVYTVLDFFQDADSKPYKSLSKLIKDFDKACKAYKVPNWPKHVLN